jgi:hypothetical protein
MKLPIHKGALFALLFLSAATLFVAVREPARFIAGALLAYSLPGFVFLTFLGERDRPALDDIFLPILFSPIILTLLVLAFHAAGSPLAGAVRASTLMLIGLLALGLIRELRGGRPTMPLPARSIAVTCALFAAAVILSYVVNRFLLVRSDAWYHASIVNEIFDRGFPPMEPLLPDAPIRYMWIYHLFVASSRTLTGDIVAPDTAVFTGLGLFNIMNALVFPYLVYRLTAFFTTRRRDLVATPILAISGLASAAWILWPLGLLRALTGEQRGWAEVMRLLRDIDINSHHVIYFLSPFEKMSPVGNWMINVVDKFVTITAFAFALNVTILVLISALTVGFGRRFAPKAFIAVFTLVLGAILFHIVGGLAIVAAVVGAGGLLALRRLVRRTGPLPLFHAFALPGAAILAAAAAFPYMLSLTSGSDPASRPPSPIHFGLRNLLTIALPLAILFVPARKAMREIFSLKTDALTLLAAWIVPLLACNLFINLAARNESKFIFPLFFILFPPIVWKILDGIEESKGPRRGLLIAWTAILFAVPPVLTYRGFILDRPQTRFEERRCSVTPDERRVYEWIAVNTPPSSVLIGSSLCDLSPVFAHRRDLHPDALTIGLFGYDSAKIRQYGAIQNKFLEGVLPAPEEMEALIGLDSPIYVALWREDLARIPRARAALDSRPDWFTLVFQNPAGLVYYVRGT